MVSFRPDTWVVAELLELPLTAAYADWQADALVQTLHPTPVHPSVHEQPEEVKLGKPPDAEEGGARERLEPSNMVPPHAGWEQFAPPNPGGQRQPDALDVP